MIRNFIYLDEQKMYSLSSQIFEGVTEYILNENLHAKEDSESQKGPVASGKVLADVIKTSSKDIEKRFLHDHSYSIFEDYLVDNNKILSIEDSMNIDISSSIDNFSFIKIKKKAVLNDIEKITHLFENFNSIGEAIAYATSFEEIEKMKLELEKLKRNTKNKSKINKLNSEFKKLTNISKIAKEQNLYQDPKFLESLVLLIKYGFSDQFEIKQQVNNILYTSCLKRENLRESEEMLVKKYSRKTEKKFVVLGLISQTFSKNDDFNENNIDDPNLKSALDGIIDALSEVETQISGKQDNEVVIDPIAVYTEL